MSTKRRAFLIWNRDSQEEFFVIENAKDERDAWEHVSKTRKMGEIGDWPSIDPSEPFDIRTVDVEDIREVAANGLTIEKGTTSADLIGENDDTE